MPTYIASNNNRFYAAPEDSFGQAAAVSAQNRFPAERVEFHQSVERARRLDKTGTRSYLGQDRAGRRVTEFSVKSYLSSWDGATTPHYGPLFAAATGGDVELTSGNSVVSASGNQLQTAQAHGYRVGSAISLNGEIRFVAQVVDIHTILLNVPFTALPQPGDLFSATAGYRLGPTLPSITIYDYWDPISAISRVLTGAAVDKMRILVNGDYHEFLFTGPAADLLDSRTFQSGDAGLSVFPLEPARAAFDSGGVPGHLGHAWIGAGAVQECLTLTDAAVEINNSLGIRNREFGALLPRAVVPGGRSVSTQFSVLAQDDEQTMQIYSAAKQRTTLSFMLQLGIQRGQLLGIYAPNVIPELPEFDDSDTRLRWLFRNNFAQGSDNDELYLAFA